MKVRWKVREYLEEHGKTPYALVQASGLATNTVYAIAAKDEEKTPKQGVEFRTLEKLIQGLELLTGRRVELADIIEVER